MRKLIWVIVSIALLLPMIAGACSVHQEPEGLQITHLITSLGSNGDNLDQTRVSYTVMIQNYEAYDAYIQSITPVLSQSVSGKVLNENIQKTVEMNLSGHQTISIDGQVLLDTSGLTKEQISAMEPFITGMEVDSQQTLEIP